MPTKKHQSQLPTALNCVALLIAVIAALIAGPLWINDTAHKAEAARLQNRVDELQKRLSSVSRRLGDSDYLDVRKLLIRKSETGRVSPRSDFFPEAHFYAPRNLTPWTLKTMPYRDLAKMIFSNDILTEGEDALSLAPLKVWSPDRHLSVRGSSVVSNLFPLIAVEKLAIADLKETMGWQTFDLDISVTNGVTNMTESHRRITLEKAFPGDAVGALLASELNALFMSSSVLEGELQGELMAVQKVDNVLYGQFRYTLKDVTVDGVKYKQYYCFLDSMAVGLPPDIYVVVALVPTTEPTNRNGNFLLVSSWFQDFAILIDP
jgi:hypothetical protein